MCVSEGENASEILDLMMSLMTKSLLWTLSWIKQRYVHMTHTSQKPLHSRDLARRGAVREDREGLFKMCPDVRDQLPKAISFAASAMA